MANPNLLSCYILTKNSQLRLKEAIVSLRLLADEIIVVDSGSTDRTEEIAQLSSVRFIFKKFENFPRQRAFAIAQCAYDWIFTIDSDEVVSIELAKRMLELKRSNFRLKGMAPDAFGIRRQWFLLGQQIHCFYPSDCPDQPIRLFRKDLIIYDVERNVHESPRGFKDTASIQEPILHYTCDSIDQMYGKLNLYSSLAAKDLLASGECSNFIKIILFPWLIWFRWYMLHAGWKDGRIGLIHGHYVRDMVYQKYLKAWHDRLVL